MSVTGNSIDIHSAATKCWLIWKERCCRIFEDKSSSSLSINLAVLRHLQFWKPAEDAHRNEANVSHQIEKTKCYWNPPLANQSKINFDAAWVSESLISGFGLILRNCAGNRQGAKSGFFKATCPEKAEALALLQGSKWAKEMNLTYLWMEGDCERIMAFTQGKNSLVKWQNESILKEAMLILSGCDNFLGFIFTTNRP